MCENLQEAQKKIMQCVQNELDKIVQNCPNAVQIGNCEISCGTDDTTNSSGSEDTSFIENVKDQGNKNSNATPNENREKSCDEKLQICSEFSVLALNFETNKSDTKSGDEKKDHRTGSSVKGKNN